MSIFVIFIQKEYPCVVWFVFMTLNIQYHGRMHVHTYTHITLHYIDLLVSPMAFGYETSRQNVQLKKYNVDNSFLMEQSSVFI
jgi:hypothetical protein